MSNFEFVFFVSLIYSTSRNRSSNSTSRISIFDSSFEFKFLEFSCRILNSPFSFRCSIRLLEFRCSSRFLEIDRQIRLLEVRVFDSNFRCKRLDFSSSNLSSNFEFVLISSTSRISIRNFDDYQVLEIVVEIVVFVSHSSFEFLIELFNFRSQAQFALLLCTDVPKLFSHLSSRFALVATRALRALFVRKILVKRQFTFSLYFGIIEL